MKRRALRIVGLVAAVAVAGLVPLELARAGTRPEPAATVNLPNVGPGAGTIGGGGNIVQSITTDAKGRVTAATAVAPPASNLAAAYNAAGTSGNTITYTSAGGAPSVRYDAAGFTTILPGLQLQTQQSTTGGADYYSPALQLTANVWSGGNGWHNASVYLASTSEYASNAQNGANLSIYTRAVNNGSENILRKIFDLGRIDNGRTTQILYSGNNSQAQWGIDDGSGWVNFGAYSTLGLRLMTGNTTGMYIDSSQRVIVGNSTSTTYKLDVLGTMHASGALTLDSTVSVGNTLTMGGNTGWITKSGGATAVPPTITWTAATYQNSWVSYGAPYEAAAYYKDAMGWVHTRGVVKTGSLNQCVFTYPAGYRPLNTHQFPLVQGAGLGGVDVRADGCFFVYSVAGGTNASMTVEIPPFYAEQ